jgi:hypothetical protein
VRKSAFRYCKKYQRESTYKEKLRILAHSFRSLILWSVGPIAFGPVVKSHNLAAAHGGGKPVTSWPGCKGQEEDVLGSHCPLQGTRDLPGGLHLLVSPVSAQWLWRSSQSVLCYRQLCLSCCVMYCFPALNFVKLCLPKSKGKTNVLNWSNKAKMWDLLKGDLSFTEVGRCYRENESSSCGTWLNSTCPERAKFFLEVPWKHMPWSRGSAVQHLDFHSSDLKQPWIQFPSMFHSPLLLGYLEGKCSEVRWKCQMHVLIPQIILQESEISHWIWILPHHVP